MAEQETRPDGERTEQPDRAQEQPKLSADFFQKLLKLPACKTTGVCDGCGRCEH